HKRRPSPKRVPLKTAETVLQLYRQKYFDFNVRHFHGKLGRARHGDPLHVGEAGAARSRTGEEATATRDAPAAAAAARDAAAHRCEQACLDWGWAAPRSDHDSERGH